jgi:HAMP domain-containing protein
MSIRTKIVSLVVFSVLLVALLVGAIAIVFTTDTMKKQILEDGRALTQALESALREPLVVQDRVKVKELVNSYGKMESVVFVAVFSPDGEVISVAPMGKPSPWLKAYLSRALEEEVPQGGRITFLKLQNPLYVKGTTYRALYLVHEAVLGGTVGHVFLALPSAFESVVKTQQKMAIYTAAAGGGMALLVALVAAIVGAGIARNVLYLADVAERMSLGELDIKVEVKTRDELGRLAEALDRMRISLKAAIERLKRRSV